MSTQKNNTLELIKLFASYMVVFIHVSFYGEIGIAINALARFAVPFFFLVSGYCSYQITAEKIKKRIKNILSLFMLSAICCTAFDIIVMLKYNTDGLIALFNKLTNISTYIDFLVFNAPIHSGHLWYLLAAFYVYVIFYFTTKFHIKETIIFIVSLVLLVLQLLLGEGLSIFGIVLPTEFVRNFALLGIPFFALGLFVKKYECKFRSIPNYLIFAFIIIGAFESILSRFFFGETEVNIGSLLVLAALVCVFIKYADAKHPAFLTALEGCSTYIYIFHIIISTALCIIYGMLGIDIYSYVILENLHPIMVCITSTIFAYVFIKIRKKVFKK